MKLHILIVDDHSLIRKGFSMILKKHDPEWEISEACDGREAVTKAGVLHPDVILMDYLMPRMDGEMAALKIRKLYPEIHIIMVSMELVEEVVIQTLSVGVRGFVPKDSSEKELLEAIHSVVKGKYYFSPKLREMTRRKEEFFQTGKNKNPNLLSKREKEVLELIYKGYTSMKIAEKLLISKRTVDHHRMKLLAKSGSRSAAGLIRFGLKTGILDK